MPGVDIDTTKVTFVFAFVHDVISIVGNGAVGSGPGNGMSYCGLDSS